MKKVLDNIIYMLYYMYSDDKSKLLLNRGIHL